VWYRKSGDYLYPAEAHPDGAGDSPHFRISKGYLYPAESHPNGTGGSPWYRIG
jgi:hypothetical protein